MSKDVVDRKRHQHNRWKQLQANWKAEEEKSKAKEYPKKWKVSRWIKQRWQRKQKEKDQPIKTNVTLSSV
jgi:hypothetical protein